MLALAAGLTLLALLLCAAERGAAPALFVVAAGPGGASSALAAVAERAEWKQLLFLTVHSGSAAHAASDNNVRVYDYERGASATGHLNLSGLALEPREVKRLGLHELRGMHAVGGMLFIAAAHRNHSKIVQTTACAAPGHEREARTFAMDGLNHPYGMAFARGVLYTGNQNSGLVVGYNINRTRGRVRAQRVAQVPNPRGLAFDREGRLWVASTSLGIVVLEPQRWSVVRRIAVRHPVGVTLDYANNVVYVGSVGDDCVYGFDGHSFRVIRTLRVPKPYVLGHPAGIAVVDNRVLVIEQRSRNLYVWDSTSGLFRGIALAGLPERSEQLVVLSCAARGNVQLK